MSVCYDPTGESYIVLPTNHALIDQLDALGGHVAEPHALPAGTQIRVGVGLSTVLADFDFETYSEAGYYFDEDAQKWRSISKSAPHGIGAVGASVYTEHQSCEVLSLAYNLKDGKGPRIWIPGSPPPHDLFDYLASGGIIEAWNSPFEYFVWCNVCVKRMGWPPIRQEQLRDAMPKARAFGLPGALGKAAKALNVIDQKIDDGKRLLTKFSKPRNPTKKDKRLRIRPTEDHIDGPLLYGYNVGDINAESAVSAETPDLSPVELELWLLDQKINFRGVCIDVGAVKNCMAIIDQAHAKYTAELVTLTGGAVRGPSEVKRIIEWLRSQGLDLPSLEADVLKETLALGGGDVLAMYGVDADKWVTLKRVLQIRASLSASSVKKLYSINRRVSADGRLRDLFAYYGAERTGRFAGRGPQPQNLPNSGPSVKQCDEISGCGMHYSPALDKCPWCSSPEYLTGRPTEWNIKAVDDLFQVATYQNLDHVEAVFDDAIAAVSGCLRGLFMAAPGHDFICSDYSAIEAVVLAALAREEWRLEVFRTHGKIYEMSASKITGVPFDDMMRHKEETGDHHPTRKKIGKVAELASGYQGGYGAWLAFGADKHLSEQEIRDAIKAWRAESPNIVKFWYGLQDAAHAAVKNPGTCYTYNDITYGVKDDVLYCQLPSGRKLCYHQPRLVPGHTPWDTPVEKLTFMGYNSDPKRGAMGWSRLETYGGKLCENVVQATARDILTHALVNVEKAGYPVVLHVHDEIVSEVPNGVGTVEEFEQIMATLPPWCADWPIRAAGGWRGKRYRKD